MWDRKILKSNAKIAIGGGRYWTCFAVVLTAAIVPGIADYFWGQQFGDYFSTLMLGGVPDTTWLAPIGIANALITFFVAYPLTIGTARFFVRNRFGNTEYGNVFSGFQNGYLNGALAMLTTRIFISLWTLLFFIPGIVKSLQYSMVQYILSDNPHIGGSRARQISRLMTEGEKGAIFVLMLSFIGWMLLPAAVGIVFDRIFPVFPIVSTLAASFSLFLIIPYYHATFAELYVFLRDRAIQSGMISPAELGLAAN